ncbi:hypothetical protein [Arthrobacter koreensis]|uniref:hypothetical protein n=1 Tax=Arthrobacter koreensis TaxID=199136 RepID=UPI0036D92681
MPDWLENINLWFAIPLQIAGFAIAYWQIAKAKNAATAAKEAAARTEKQIGANLLLVVLPELNQIETNLEWAVGQADRNATIHYLASWRWQAGQLRGHLMRQGGVDDKLLTQIQQSIATAADTKLALSDTSADVAKRCRAALKSIAHVTGTVGELMARNSIEGAITDGAD